MNDRLLTDLYVAIETLDEAIKDGELPEHLVYMLVIAQDNIRTVTNNVEATA